MTGNITARFEFFGAHKGKDKTIGNHVFVGGKYRLTESAEGVAGATKYLRSFGAFAVGSDEYEAAQKAELGASDGNSAENEAAPKSGSPETVSGDAAPGTGNDPAPATDSGEPVGSDAGDAGVLPEGDGQSDAGDDPESEPVDVTPAAEVDAAMVTAVHALDPDVDEHWTEAGAPALSAIESAYGSAGVTRDDIDNAVPGWDRAQAKELKDLS